MGGGQVVGDAGAMKRMLMSVRRFVGRTRAMHGSLVDCRCCGSDFVNPVSWQPQGESEWWMRLRCGECGFVSEVEVSNEEAERFDAELNRGMAKIASAVARLDRARMIVESDILAAALERDLIDPSDFGR
jgi:uncharacterized Zn finger protein